MHIGFVQLSQIRRSIHKSKVRRVPIFMLIFMILIGFMALVSGYLVSLENRLQRDNKFHPFSLHSNLNISPKARKVLAWLGIMIWIAAAALYVFGPPLDLSNGDALKVAGVVVGLLAFMLYGYGREIEFEKTGKSSASFAFADVMEQSDWLSVLLKASLALGKLMIFFIVLYCLKHAMNA